MAANNGIEKVLDDFDFKTVRTYMKANDIKWSDGLPTIRQLRSTAKKLLKECARQEFGTRHSLGGLTAYCVNGLYCLEYALVSAEYYDRASQAMTQM